MLSALLPGVREFRTPLVTGLLWAASLWLLFGPAVAESEASTELAARLEPLGLPNSVWLGAGALLTYLVGSLLVFRHSPLQRVSTRLRHRLIAPVERLEQPVRPVRKRYVPVWWLWQRFQYRGPAWTFRNWVNSERYGQHLVEINAFLDHEFWRRSNDGRAPVMRSFEGSCNPPVGFEGFYEIKPEWEGADDLRASLAEHFVREVKSEQPAVETRIQLDYPELYSEVDRLKVEAEFRFSIFLPLVLLIFVLAAVWSPWVLATTIAPFFMLRDALGREKQANDKVWQVFLAGKVSTPVLDQMDSAAEEPVGDAAERFYGFRSPDREE